MEKTAYTLVTLFFWVFSFLTVYWFALKFRAEILLDPTETLNYFDIWVNSFYFIKLFIMLSFEFFVVFNIMYLNLPLSKFLDLLFLILLKQTRFLAELSVLSLKINFIDFTLQELTSSNTVFYNDFFVIFWHIFFLIFIVILWLGSQYDLKYYGGIRYYDTDVRDFIFYSFLYIGILFLLINIYIIYS